MYIMNSSHKQYLKDKYIEGAKQYKNHLMNKEFLIICEDGDFSVVRFFKKDFLHLVGIETTLNEDNFFDNCCDGMLSENNIDSKQKYNWSTLKSKAIRIEKIQTLIYENVKESLFIINLHTNTADFPIAIRNAITDTCVGFRGKLNKARTLRKYSNSGNADTEKRIIAIFSKQQDTSKRFDSLIYITTIQELYMSLNNFQK